MRGRDVAIALVILFLLSKKKKGQGVMQAQQFAPGVKHWESPLLLAGSEVVAPITFLLSWIRVESGGNPCAVGTPTGEGGPLSPEGEPWEVSIWQLDPGNLATAGFTAKQLRPCCPSSTGSRAQVEACSRALTADEESEQVQAGLNYIKACRKIVDTQLAAVGAFDVEGTTWSRVGPSDDYLRAVKSCHGSTWVMNQGLPAVAKRLGRAPRSWVELAHELRTSPPASAPRSLERVLVNAEETVPG